MRYYFILPFFVKNVTYYYRYQFISRYYVKL